MSNSKSLGVVFQSSRARNNSGNSEYPSIDNDLDDANTLEELNGKLNRLRLASRQTIHNAKLAEIEKSIKEIEHQIESLNSGLSRESSGIRKLDSKSAQSLVFSPVDSKFEGSSPTFAISGILQELGNQNADNKLIIENSNALVSIFQMHPYLKTDLTLSPFGSRIQALLLNPQSEVIACAYRISRYILLDSGILELFNTIRLDLFLVISLSKEPKDSMEKSEAVKLLRAIAEVDKNTIFINLNIVKSLLAILDHEEDPFYPIVLETVCEFCFSFPELMYEAYSFKYIIKSLMSGTSEFSECCLLWLLEMLDHPRTRKIVLYDFDPSLLVAPFIEHRVRIADGNHRVDLKLLNHTGFLVSTFLKVLPGIYIVGQKNCTLVEDLLDCLDHRAVEICLVVLSIIADVFRLKVFPSTAHREDQERNYGIASDITNHGLALLLRLFLDKGLLYKLGSLVEDSTIFKTQKEIELLSTAKDLMVGLLVLSSNLLPENYTLNEMYKSLVPLGYTDLNKLPDKYESLERQFRPDRICSKITRKDLTIPKNSKQTPLKVDDPLLLRQKLMDTNVLIEKDYTKWDWGLVNQLIEGPLQNTTRLEETLRSTKFLKRIMSFYRPLKYRFSKLKRTEANKKFLDIGCKLMEALIKCDEGLSFLRESDLLKQLYECLAQETMLTSSKAANSIFSASKIRESMTYGYFRITGVLSRTVKSVKLLKEAGVLRMYDVITDSSAEREDLTKLILTENDYHISHTMQQILTKIAISASEKFRLFCTKLIVELLQKQEEAQEFFIEVLINQMYDSQESIANLAISEVDNYATNKAQIEKFVETQPEPSILFKMKADSLLRKVFSVPRGYNYLHDLGFINDSLKNWITEESVAFVGRVEEIVNHDLFIDSSSYSFHKSKRVTHSKLPFHLYGEMVRTEEGALKLKHSGIVRNCSDFVQKFQWEKIEECDSDRLTLLKSCLWSLGFICSHPLGIKLVQGSNIVEDIIKRTETCPQISVRGVCFYVLGLIARTKEGAEILDDEGWGSVFDKVDSSPVGICLPTDLSKFFFTEESRPYRKRSATLIHEDLLNFWNGSSMQPENMIVISEICKNLINIILYPQKSISQLHKIKSRYSDVFDTDPNLLLIVMALFEQYNYGLRARRFILLELFKAQELAGMCTKRSRKKMKEKEKEKEKEKLYRTPPPLS